MNLLKCFSLKNILLIYSELVFQESSYRIIQHYKMLCTAEDEKRISVCKSGNEDILTNIVKNAFIDESKSIKDGYNFDHDPPILDGQTGVPHLVDKILGNMD